MQIRCRFVKRSNEMFNVVMLVQFSVSAFVICMSTYMLSQMTMHSPGFTFLIVYVSCMIVQIFLFCWYGNEVIMEVILFAMYKNCTFHLLYFDDETIIKKYTVLRVWTLVTRSTTWIGIRWNRARKKTCVWWWHEPIIVSNTPVATWLFSLSILITKLVTNFIFYIFFPMILSRNRVKSKIRMFSCSIYDYSLFSFRQNVVSIFCKSHYEFQMKKKLNLQSITIFCSWWNSLTRCTICCNKDRRTSVKYPRETQK